MNGITLISLVVTIIILLILAGISIGMLSGDNGILGQAGNAKTQTDIAVEKEIIDLAVVHAMGKSKYGDIDETSFTNELEKNNATVTKSGSKYKVAFSSGRQYTVDQDGNVKEKKVNPNALEISELSENANTYFGWDVINYTETLDSSLNYMKWQLFYAGAMDGELEDRIYLISKEYVKNTDLPAKNGATPIAGNTVYKARFGSDGSSGIIPQYTGTESIATNMQKYNSDYFKDYTSANINMKAVAYMLDTTIWESFAIGSQEYAEWAIGGPTVELLFKSYNKYAGTIYEYDAVSANGYKVRKKSSNNFDYSITNAITNDTSTVDSPYSVSNIGSQANRYWLASPCSLTASTLMSVAENGQVGFTDFNDSNGNAGFRPVVLLKSNYTLEKTKDLNGNDAFKIIEQ